MVDLRRPASSTGNAPRGPVDRLIVGRLLEHGEAPHEFRARAELSYYVRLDTERGARTLWSPGLKRALDTSSSRPQLGDWVGVKENSIEPVSVVTRRRDAAGQLIEQRRYDAPRTHWVIEKREWFDEQLAAATRLRDLKAHPREAIRDHPALLGAYLTLDSARKFAAERFENPEHRERFLGLVREVLARATERGVPPPIVKVREAAQASEPKALAVRSTSREARER